MTSLMSGLPRRLTWTNLPFDRPVPFVTWSARRSVDDQTPTTAFDALGPDTVLPTSILYDSNGKEVWRYVGDLDWTSAEAAKLLSEAGAAPKVG